MTFRIPLLLGAAAVSACGGAPVDRTALRAAVDEAQLTLREAVPLAISTTQGGTPVNGSLVRGSLLAFDVGAREAQGMSAIRVSAQDGSLISSGPVAEENIPPCTAGAIPLDQALAIAEAEASGEAIAVVPDDDVACAREIQVLSELTLWEVKVGGDGAVLEKEESDEFGGKED